MIPPESLDCHDPLLRPFLLASDEAEAERCLEALLVGQAAPVIRRILGTEALLYPLGDAPRRQRAEDVYGDVLVSLLERLRMLRAAPTEGSIPDFGGYAAVTTYHAVYQLLRKLFPRRANLKNKMRYVLEHHPALAMWQSGEKLFLTGLVAWRGGEKAVPGARLRQRLEQKDELARGSVCCRMCRRRGCRWRSCCARCWSWPGSPWNMESWSLSSRNFGA